MMAQHTGFRKLRVHILLNDEFLRENLYFYVSSFEKYDAIIHKNYL